MSEKVDKTQCDPKKKSKFYSWRPSLKDLISIVCVAVAATTFALTTFSTKAALENTKIELNERISVAKLDLNERIRLAKVDIETDVNEKHQQVLESQKDIKELLKKMDNRLWEVQKQTKKN